MPGAGEIRRHIRRPRRHRHRGGEVQLLPPRRGLIAERPAAPAASRTRSTSCRYARRYCRPPCRTGPRRYTRRCSPGTARPGSSRWYRSTSDRARSASRPARCCTGTGGPAVVKLHEYGPLIGVPEAFCAPDTVAVYVVARRQRAGRRERRHRVTAAEAHRPGHAVPARVHHRERHRARRHRLRERRRRRRRHRTPPSPPSSASHPSPPAAQLGVTAFDGDDAGPVPTALVADTVNV